MIYGLAEGLRLVRQEGLSARFARHRRANQAMAAGMEAMGLSLGVEAEIRLPSLITVRIPEGVEDAAVRRRLLEEFNIEIGGGLGPLKGQIWRIGTMGEGARLEPVVRVLAGLGAILRRPGGAEAATEAWESFS
jgi:aspartate aminotransferase-like enzyme